MYVRSHRKERYRSLQYALQEIWIFLMNGTCGSWRKSGEKEKELKDEELDKIYGEFNPEDPRFREMLDDRDLLYIDGLECGDLVAELKDKIAGSYVAFCKSRNPIFPQNPVQRSDAALRKKTEMLS